MSNRRPRARKRSQAAKSTTARERAFKYPRPHKTGVLRWIPSLRLVLLVILGFAFLCAATFVAGYVTTDIPPANAAAQEQTSIVYYADGHTELGRFSDLDRESVPIDKISEPMQHAVVSAEDQSFYENRGISVKGIGRAVWGVVSGDYAGGGSTITQQYVKNFYLNDEHTLTRKVKEMFISLKIDQQQSKDQILAHYLNTIYLGRGNYGVETAAQEYFDEPASKLNTAQSAMLAAMIQRPGAADPAKDPGEYKPRFNYVLDNMVEEGYLTKAQRQQVKFPKVEKDHKSKSMYSGTKGYLLEYVRKELKHDADISPEQLKRGGYRIVTTFHQKAMKAATDAVDTVSDRPKSDKVGLTSINPKSGAIVAMYGGKNYLDNTTNNAAFMTAQAGSTFKPFTLIAALESGVRLDDYYTGNNMMSIDGFDDPVKNDNGESFGQISVLDATAKSVNTVYAQINTQVGPKHTEKAAIQAGLPKDTSGLAPNPANVLGTASPTNLEMANAFATFASQGVRHDPHAVKKVKSPNGNLIYKSDTSGKRVFKKSIMSETTYALHQVIEDGTATNAQALDRPAAGKTGTSDGPKSAWFVGYTPQLATAVSMFGADEHGGPEDLEGFGRYPSYIYGGSYPTLIWTDYMKDALAGKPVAQLPGRMDLPNTTPPGGSHDYTPPPTTSTPEESESSESSTPSEEPTSEPSESPSSPASPTEESQPTPSDTESPTNEDTDEGSPEPDVKEDKSNQTNPGDNQQNDTQHDTGNGSESGSDNGGDNGGGAPAKDDHGAPPAPPGSRSSNGG